MDDKWIDSIKNKMSEFEAIPPDGLLDSVNKKIKARRLRKWRVFSVAAASVAVITSISIALIPDRLEITQTDVSVTSQAIGVKEFSSIKEKETIVATVEKRSRQYRLRSQLISQNGGRGVPASYIVSKNDSAAVPFIKDAEKESPKQKEHVAKTNLESSCETDIIDSDISVDTYAEGSDRHSIMSVGVVALANGLGGLFDGKDLSGHPINNFTSSSVNMTRMGGGNLSNSNNRPSNLIEIFDHKLPLRFSMNLSFPIIRNVNLETGISYSFLRSYINFGYSDSPVNKAQQNLHFLGIPVSLRYTPLSFHRLDIYVSGGFLIEKCLAGQIKEERKSSLHYSYPGCNDRPFQFSINAAAGLQYNLSRQCGIFMEPGVGIYFKNGSMLRTIYSEKPITFNVNIGIRFDYLK